MTNCASTRSRSSASTTAATSPPAPPEYRAAVDELIPGLVDAFNYEHRPLIKQLDELGVRQFELDIFVDPDGTLYGDHKSYVAAGPDLVEVVDANQEKFELDALRQDENVDDPNVRAQLLFSDLVRSSVS